VTLRVLSLNIWNDSDPWKARLEQIRRWIAHLDPDVIGFQEVVRGNGVDLLNELVADMPYGTDFARASTFWKYESDFGNAVASRWPITDREEVRLPDKGDGETRVALSVAIESPFGEVCFTSTHLNWKFHHGAVRERQVVAVCDLALRRRPRGGFPPIVVGDFNAEPESAEIRYMTGLQSLEGKSVYFHDSWRLAGSGGAGITWSNRNKYARMALEPDRRIDYIFVGNPMITGAGLVERCRVVCDENTDGVWPSDHFGVYAELRTEALPGRER
jgi:endonuclease/exonuclease/phosphatase family metal-dependent hydrolase